ncbi:MAG: autotransporter domain-containing protein [Planctomycetota bacterium]
MGPAASAAAGGIFRHRRGRRHLRRGRQRRQGPSGRRRRAAAQSSIFVRDGGTLILENSGISGGAATGGQPGGGSSIAQPGQALATGIFLHNADLNARVTAGNSITISDIIADNSATNGGDGSASQLVKSGDGMLVLSGNNKYSGNTVINEGTLSIATDSNLGNSSGSIVFDGGTLLPGNGFVSSRDVTIDADGGTIDLNGGDVLLTGIISGNGRLDVTGGGLLETNAFSNSFTGTTVVQNGSTLGVYGELSGTIIVHTGGTLAGGNGLGLSLGNVGANNGFDPGTIIGTVLIEKDGYISPRSEPLLITSPTVPPQIGTLQIVGSYTQRGTYLVDINSQGQSDHVKVLGTASIGGNVFVRAIAGDYMLGQNFKILSATGGVTGTFDSVEDNLPLFDAFAIYDPFDVYIELGRNQTNFADVAATYNQLQVANTLDKYAANNPSSTSPLGGLIDSLSLGNTSSIQFGLQQLDAELFGGLASIQIESTDLYLRSTMAHLQQFLTGGIGPMPGTSFAMAQNPTAPALPQTTRSDLQLVSFQDPQAIYAQPAYDLGATSGHAMSGWMQGIGAGGAVGTNGNAVGLGYGIGATAFGVDWRIDNTLLGVGGGYAYTSVAQSSGLGNADVNSLHFSLYGLHQWERAYVVGLAGYAYDQYDTSRNINIGQVVGQASADYSGHEFLSYLESGLNVPVGGWTLQPLAGLRYLLLGQDSFTESGTGAADLFVNGQSFDSLRYSLGSRLFKSFETKCGLVTPYVQGRWTHEVLENQRLIDAQFAGVVGGSFVSQGNVLGRDFGEFGTGVTVNLTERIQVFAGYDAQISSRQSAHGGIGGLQIQW